LSSSGEPLDEGMTIEEFLSQPTTISTDHESVARAVRYLEWWLPVARKSIGIATEDAMKTLMEFARQRTGAQ
jgi:hypothetical protein